MRIPTYRLIHEVSVETYLGAGGLGPVYAPVRKVRALIMPLARAKNEATDDATATAVFRPEEASGLVPSSRITYQGVEYFVLDTQEFAAPRRATHVNARLR